MAYPYAAPIPTRSEIDVEHKEQVFRVGEYLNRLNFVMKPLRATLQGEIGGKIGESEKGWYFTLCDKDEMAVLDCICWKTTLRSIGITLQTGMEVKIDGYAQVYKPWGRLQLQVQHITP